MNKKIEIFELKEEHIKLLNNAYVQLSNYETGSPEIDGKRPYGNSSVAYDVIEILEWEDEEDEISEELVDKALNIHYETVNALQIILSCKTFELGTYAKINEYPSIWENIIL